MFVCMYLTKTLPILLTLALSLFSLLFPANLTCFILLFLQINVSIYLGVLFLAGISPFSLYKIELDIF